MTWAEANAVLTRLGVHNGVWCGTYNTMLRYLFESCLGKARAVEVGTLTGVSALAMALAGVKVTTFDLYDVNADDAHWSTLEGIEDRHRIRPVELMEAAGVLDRVTFVAKPAPGCFEYCPWFDVAFLDGWKHEQVVYESIKAACRLGRHIIIHDIYPGGDSHDGRCNDEGPYHAYEQVRLEHPEYRCELIQSLYGKPERAAQIWT
jgi:predicted O-methyltransferase YrrM